MIGHILKMLWQERKKYAGVDGASVDIYYSDGEYGGFVWSDRQISGTRIAKHG